MIQPIRVRSGESDVDDGDVTSGDQQVAGPAGPAPVRPVNSIRRTSSVDMQYERPADTVREWPPPLTLVGRARDAVTVDPRVPPVVVDVAATEVRVGANRTIEAIASSPVRAGIDALVGARGGGHLRAQLDEVLPGEREHGSPLYLLLDDISGTSLIGGFVFTRHPELLPPPDSRRPRADMAGVCIGLAPGATSLIEQQKGIMVHRVRQVVSVVNPDDPHGWHDFPPDAPVSMRRARRIDVWRDDVIRIDSAFQDSAVEPTGGRVAVHEYLLRATADPVTEELLTVDADPRVLPYLECPGAALTARQLVGVPLPELRRVVLERLGRVNGCTHLNDALRALAEVPVLLAHLDQVAGGS